MCDFLEWDTCARVDLAYRVDVLSLEGPPGLEDVSSREAGSRSEMMK